MCRCNNLPIDKLADCHITQLFIMLEKLKEKGYGFKTFKDVIAAEK